MNETQIRLEHLLTLYNTSANKAHELLLGFGFVLNQRLDNSTLYQAHDKGFVLTEEDGFITKVQYKTTDEVNYNNCIEYAKKTLVFKTIFEELKPSGDILRLDDAKRSLICMALILEGRRLSFGITLLAKLALPTPENKVEVILTAPPCE